MTVTAVLLFTGVLRAAIAQKRATLSIRAPALRPHVRRRADLVLSQATFGPGHWFSLSAS